jgi:hypothetical protein
MDATSNVVSWISKSNAVPVACSGLTMDLDRRAWTMALEYLTASLAASALEERLGPPDSRILLGLVKRWNFAGTTVELRGRVATVAEPF